MYVAALLTFRFFDGELTQMLGVTFADPWRFQANPEVYLLVAFLIGAYVYSVRVIGPRAVAPGQPVVTRTNIVLLRRAR